MHSRGIISRAVAAPLTTYTTNFTATENPYSDGSKWTQGGTVGIDWQNVQSTGGSPGIAWGTGASDVDLNDNIATLTGVPGISSTKFFVEIDYYRKYTPGVSHEVELLGLFTISGHSARGYEIDLAANGIEPVRWNGNLNDFEGMGVSGLTTLTGGDPGNVFVDGDRVRAEFDSTSGNTIIELYRNGSSFWKVQDATVKKITSGFPGMGHFYRTGATPNQIAISRFSAGNF